MTNGGDTFSNTHVTDVGSKFDGDPNGPGDYSGIATIGTTVYTYFVDLRGSNKTDDDLANSIDGGFEIYSAVVLPP